MFLNIYHELFDRDFILVTFTKLDTDIKIKTAENAVVENPQQKASDAPLPLVTKIPKLPLSEIPKDVNGQLKLMLSNAKIELEFMPWWLKIFGFEKLKKEVVTLVDKPEFHKELTQIFEEEKKKKNNAKKDVVSMMKTRDVYDSVCDCIQKHSSEHGLIRKVIKRDLVRNNYYEMVKKGSHACLLYGDD